MSIRFALLSLFACVPLTGFAVTPDVEPGQWEYVNAVSVEGPMAIPDQRDTYRECVTLEDIERGEAFLEDMPEECEISNKEISASGMSYDMVCQQPNNMRMDMAFDMQFMGDRVQGKVTGAMKTPMGNMDMNIDVEGKRVGDC